MGGNASLSQRDERPWLHPVTSSLILFFAQQVSIVLPTFMSVTVVVVGNSI